MGGAAPASRSRGRGAASGKATFATGSQRSRPTSADTSRSAFTSISSNRTLTTSAVGPSPAVMRSRASVCCTAPGVIAANASSAAPKRVPKVRNSQRGMTTLIGPAPARAGLHDAVAGTGGGLAASAPAPADRARRRTNLRASATTMITDAAGDADRPQVQAELGRVEHTLQRAERRRQEDGQHRQPRGLEQRPVLEQLTAEDRPLLVRRFDRRRTGGRSRTSRGPSCGPLSRRSCSRPRR